MKVKEIKVRIESLDEFFDRAVEELEDIEEGKADTFKEDSLSFISVEQMRKYLTPKRLELVSKVKHEKPGSIYELAKMVDRKPENVNKDLKLLEQMGLVKLTKVEKVRERVIPEVNYDKMVLEIAV